MAVSSRAGNWAPGFSLLSPRGGSDSGLPEELVLLHTVWSAKAAGTEPAVGSGAGEHRRAARIVFLPQPEKNVLITKSSWGLK